MLTLGIDTSNYTTSAALYDCESGEVIQEKQLLPVKKGEKGLRQSDAVFHHTAQLYPLVEKLLARADGQIGAVGVSSRPRDAQGSYMPCFTVGVNAAHCVAAALGAPLMEFSHQAGHIAAALFSCGRLDLLGQKFIAFHVSGGTTEMLIVSPGGDLPVSVEIIGKTLDLNAGQAIDRAGVMLGLDFPCGAQLEKLALNADKVFSPKVCVNGGDCNLSGAENQCKKMLDCGEKRENIARFCIDYVLDTIEKMTLFALKEHGALPIVYAGGVMSDSIIRQRLQKEFGAYFAEPAFSCDNAAGVAYLAHERCVGL